MMNIATGIISNLVMKKFGGKSTLPQTKIPPPPTISLSQFRARSGRRGHGFYSPQPKPADVETPGTTSAATQYNAVLRKMLNLQKYE